MKKARESLPASKVQAELQKLLAGHQAGPIEKDLGFRAYRVEENDDAFSNPLGDSMSPPYMGSLTSKRFKGNTRLILAVLRQSLSAGTYPPDWNSAHFSNDGFRSAQRNLSTSSYIQLLPSHIYAGSPTLPLVAPTNSFS